MNICYICHSKYILKKSNNIIIKKLTTMKKVLLILMFICANIMAMGQDVISVGENINVYYKSGQLCETGKLEKKGSDYYVILGKRECKLTPCHEVIYGSRVDKEVTYYYKLTDLGVELMIKDKIVGAPEVKSSQSTSKNKEEDNDDCAVKDGKVILYHRNGEVLQSAKIMDKNGTTHVKVDNGLYKLEACNKKFNGVTYNYSVFLFDTEYYVKGNIPGFKGSKSSSGTTSKKSSTTKKSSNSSSVKNKISKGVKKLKKRLN